MIQFCMVPRLCWCTFVLIGLSGCAGPTERAEEPSRVAAASQPATAPAEPAEPIRKHKRDTIAPRSYPLDTYGFTPVDKDLQKAFAREEMITDDAEGSLNPYIMRVIAAYPLDGSYPYHCSWKPREYDIYNGVTEDLWFKGLVVAKAYPDGSRCSYCCGLTFEIFFRAMQLRNVQKGLDPDDFNGMTFHDLFNLLQLWYIEGKGDCVQRGIVAYGLGTAITDFEQARPGDLGDYSFAPSGGHSIVFISWLRDEQGKIIGMRYFSSNLSGTKGVGYGESKFADSNNGRGIIRKWLRLARVGSISSYKPFNRLDIPRRNAYAPIQPSVR